MARKIRFDIAPEFDAAPEVVEPAPRAPSLSGMAKSLQAAAAASIRDIDPALIEDSAYHDRLELDEAELEELAQSIQSQGQHIPILVSPLPQGRFRIVYGRRRLAALRRLGMAAKALVRDLSDDQAIIAQGQENTFRKDLSWIEKATFARQLMEAGRSDDLICDTLNIDQKARREGDKLTGLSRMKQVTSRISPLLIHAVGPAPKVGRDRWYDLALSLDRKLLGPEAQAPFVDLMQMARDLGHSSDARFEQLERAVADHGKAAKPDLTKPSTDQFRTPLGQVRATPRNVTITVQARDNGDLHRWIRENPEAALAALQAAAKP